MAQIRIKRGTLAQLNAAATAETLAVGEPYLVTDRAQLAVGTSAGAYALAAREADLLLPRSTHDLGVVVGGVTVSLYLGHLITMTLGGNITITLPGVGAGTTEHLTLLLTNDGTAGRSITIPGIVWLGGVAPTFDPAASARNIIVLRGTAAGWIGDGGKA